MLYFWRDGLGAHLRIGRLSVHLSKEFFVIARSNRLYNGINCEVKAGDGIFRGTFSN